jgi:hypothetical protein
MLSTSACRIIKRKPKVVDNGDTVEVTVQGRRYYYPTDAKFVVNTSDKYANMHLEPSVNSTVLAAIPIYKVLWEYRGSRNGWILVSYRDAMGKTEYGYVHGSNLLRLPRDRIYPRSGVVSSISRVINLKSIEQEENFTLSIFLFATARYGFILKNGTHDARPIYFMYDMRRGFGLDEKSKDTQTFSLAVVTGNRRLSFTFDYEDIGYAFDDDRKIERYLYTYLEDEDAGIIAFDVPNLMIFRQPSISKMVYYIPKDDTNEGIKINFVVESDIILDDKVDFFHGNFYDNY